MNPLGRICWPHRLSVRTPGFHPGKRGSTPLGATNKLKSLEIHSRDFLVYGTQGEANEKGVGKTSVCPSGVTEVCRGLEGGNPIERIRQLAERGSFDPLGAIKNDLARNEVGDVSLPLWKKKYYKSLKLRRRESIVILLASFYH